MAEHRVADSDLERWVAEGIVSAEQRQAILRDLEQHPREAAGLTVTTLLYYSGGLLTLVAYAIFLGFQWDAMNAGGRVAIAAASLVFFAIVSQVLLAMKRFQLPGELLQVVAVTVVPLLTFALLDAAGWWPEAPRYYASVSARQAYQYDLTWARLGLAVPTVLAASLAFWKSRSPFVVVPALVGLVALALDMSLLARGDFEQYTWTAAQSIVVTLVGAAMFAAGVRVRGVTERNYSFWFYLVGVGAMAAGLGVKALSETGVAWGIPWLIVALALLAISVPLQERILAAAGLLGVFVYLGKLVFDVFASANAALAMIVVGVLVLGAGLLYQRFTERLAARPGT